MPGGNAWDGPEGENALSAVFILLVAAPSPPPGRQELEGPHRRASLPPVLCLPHPLIPHSLGEGARPLGVVREVTAEEENQYLVCLEKQQYFNSEMPEETAGLPHLQAYANQMQSYSNLQSKQALPPTPGTCPQEASGF